MDLLFEHEGKTHRVVCIDYNGEGHPHAVITDNGSGIQEHWDFEKECKWDDELTFMYYNSGGGGRITEIDLGTGGPPYWLHESAALNKPYDATRLAEPLMLPSGNRNPFHGNREVLDLQYCEVCDKHYDEDWCSLHHYEDGEGNICCAENPPDDNN